VRIALILSRYRSELPSGEVDTVRTQAQLLREAGHDARIIGVSTDDLAHDRLYPLRAAFNVATGGGWSPVAELNAFAPDVVHVHNLFPNISTDWLAGWRGPVIATMHNYRVMCAAGTLTRDGEPCELCITGNTRPAIQHGCYRGSRLATVPLAWRNARPVNDDPVIARADRIIAPSQTMADTLEIAGVAPSRITVIPNPVPDLGAGQALTSGNGRWLFVGRLTAEKGIDRVVRSWPADVGLDVIGTGPLEQPLRYAAGPIISWLGVLRPAEVAEQMRQAQGLVFASTAREAQGLVYAEALAAGIPTLSWGPNAVTAAVSHDQTGAVVSDCTVEGWQNAIESVLADPHLREHCRAIYERDYTSAAWLRLITEQYEALTR